MSLTIMGSTTTKSMCKTSYKYLACLESLVSASPLASVQLKQGPQYRLAVWMGLNTSSGYVLQANTTVETLGPRERTQPSNLL